MKRLSFFVAVTLACTLLAGPGQQALLTVKPLLAEALLG